MYRLIDFNLEITKGCKYDCTGCKVDKTINSMPPEQDFDRLEKLVDELNFYNFKAMNLAIGPTDILTSDNKDIILSSQRLKLFSSKFLKTSINCAFLESNDIDYIDLGKRLNWLLNGGLVKFVVPFEAFHIDNENYLKKIKNRIDLTLANMPNVTHTKTYLIVNYETASIYDRKNNRNLTEELLFKVYNSELLKHFDVGLVLPHTRLNLRNEYVAGSFIDAVKKLKNLLVSARGTYGKDQISIAEIDPTEGTDWDIFYRDGKLYMTPFILEGLASFDEIFEIAQDWTFDNLYQYHNDSIVNQLNWADTVDDCKQCRFKLLCAERGVHKLMKITNTSECISPAKNLENEIPW